MINKKLLLQINIIGQQFGHCQFDPTNQNSLEISKDLKQINERFGVPVLYILLKNLEIDQGKS